MREFLKRDCDLCDAAVVQSRPGKVTMDRQKRLPAFAVGGKDRQRLRHACDTNGWLALRTLARV